jgi:DNA-binding NtrC family response regulator
LKRFAAQADRVISDFDSAASERLRRFDWPGNVRQLQNEIQRTVLMCEGQSVESTDLTIGETPGSSPNDTGDQNLTLMEAMERSKIIEVLKETGGNKLETAKRLGIGRQTLYNKIRNYQIAA